MSKHLIDVQIEEQVGQIEEKPISRAALVTLTYLQVEESCEVSVVVSDDAALEDLNRRFRGEPHPTDVLSFSNDTRGPFSGGAAGFPRYLGDIVISIDRARAQAEVAGGTVTEELQLLTVHGVLHLLGFDHADEREKEQMWTTQSEILRLLDVNIPLPE